MMISVIIPCYNCQEFVSRAVESVLSQTYSNFEILLIDNNSTDSTWDVINSYANKYTFISAYKELKPGSAAARNHGLNLAKGSWIQFLDADDELLPGKLETQVSLGLRENADIVVGSAIAVSENEDGQVEQKQLSPIVDDKWLALIYSRMGITTANLWKHEALEKVGGWDESLSSSQEYDLMFRILQADGVVAFDLSYFTIIHKRIESISRTTNLEKLKSIVDNRIQIRYRVKAHLKAIDQLDLKRDKAINEYIFVELKKYEDQLPAFVRERLSGVNVPIKLRVKRSAWFKKIRTFIKHISNGR